VGGQQGVDPFGDLVDHGLGLGGIAPAHLDDSEDHGKQVLDPVIELVGEKVGPVAGAGEFGRAFGPRLGIGGADHLHQSQAQRDEDGQQQAGE